MIGIAQPLPIINVQCVHTKPFASVKLRPHAFVLALGVPTDDSVEGSSQSILLDFLDNALSDRRGQHEVDAGFTHNTLCKWERSHEDCFIYVTQWFLIKRGVEALYPTSYCSFKISATNTDTG